MVDYRVRPRKLSVNIDLSGWRPSRVEVRSQSLTKIGSHGPLL